MAKNNRQLSHGQEAILRIPNSPSSFTCYNWIKNVFDLMGDKQPTNEIHLDPTGIEEFRQQYVEAISYAKDSHLGCRAFTSMWEACFVFVKICELKAVNCKYIRSYDNVDFYFILFFRSFIHGLSWAMQGDHLESCTY